MPHQGAEAAVCARRIRKRTFYCLRRPSPRSPHESPGPDNPLRSDVRAYLDYWRCLGYRPAGVRLRALALARFAGWTDAQGLDSPAQVTPFTLEQYRLHLFNSRKLDGGFLAANTQQLLLVPVRGFFKWLARTRRLASNPAQDLELPRKPVRLPTRVLSLDEVERVIREADVAVPWGIRDRAILEVLYSTGMRRSEFAALALHDWDRARGSIAIRQGKGGRDRIVPVGHRAAGWLAAYLDTVRPVLARSPDDGTLFLTDYAEPFIRNRLGDLVRRYLDWAGIDIPGSCHLFRHACATHMLDNGADIRIIQALLGHADLRSTQIYTQVSITKLLEVHSRTHPAERLSPKTSESGGNKEAWGLDWTA